MSRRKWTPQDAEIIRELVASKPHWTASDLAGVFGVSRCALIGKLHRMGISLMADGRGQHPERIAAISDRISCAHAKRRERCPECGRVLPRES